MADVSFANLDQDLAITFDNDFIIRDELLVEFSSIDGVEAGFDYSYLSTGGDDWEFAGLVVSDDGMFPTGGTVTSIQLDLDNDAAGAPEINITGLSFDITDLNIGAGTATEQKNRLWETVLGGDDTFDFNMIDYSIELLFAGDGADLNDGGAHQGGDDIFNAGAASLSNSNTIITGDFFNITDNSTAQGGNDTMHVGARVISGDFLDVYSGVTAFVDVFGGDDVIAPAAFSDATSPDLIIYGDAQRVYSLTTFFAGDDFIDLRATDFTGFTGTTFLYGDAFSVLSRGVLVGGDDTIHGYDGADQIFGDSGFGRGTAGGNDQLFGHGGNDTVYGSGGYDTLDGGSGVDRLFGGWGRDFIEGGDGNDQLFGDGDQDTLYGGDGDDTLDGGHRNDTLFGGAGTDDLRGGSGPDLFIVLEGEFQDSIQGGSGDDTLDLSDITSAAGAVTIDLGAGVIDGLGPATTITGTENIIGTQADDTITGTLSANYLFGAGGDDLISGASLLRNDTLNGGTGDDTVDFAYLAMGVRPNFNINVNINLDTALASFDDGGTITEILNFENAIGGDGDDTITGTAGANALTGNAGDDRVLGRAGDDRLFAGSGDDRAEGGGGADNVLGGPGRDTLLGGGDDDTVGGGNKSDLLRGNAGRDLLLGSNGNDRLFGGTAADTLQGGNGRDTLNGSSGPDVIKGDGGNDLVSYDDSSAGVFVRLWAGDGTGGDADGDTLFDIENLEGSAFRDTLQGTNSANRLEGGDGDDILQAIDGDDILIGERGADLLTGGDGDDTFLFFRGDGEDTIKDFAAGAGTDDVIRLFGFGAAFDSFAEVIAASFDDGTNTTINFGGGNSILLNNVTVGDLHQDDFIF